MSYIYHKISYIIYINYIWRRRLQSVQSWSTSTLCLHSSAWGSSLLILRKRTFVNKHLSWWRTIDAQSQGKTSHPVFKSGRLVEKRKWYHTAKIDHFVYLVIRSMETVVKNFQNMRELSLQRANAFQVLRRLQFKSQYWKESRCTDWTSTKTVFSPPLASNSELLGLEAVWASRATLLRWRARGPAKILVKALGVGLLGGSNKQGSLEMTIAGFTVHSQPHFESALIYLKCTSSTCALEPIRLPKQTFVNSGWE